MALLAQSSDYTDKDFDSLRLRLQNLVRTVFPEWTDFNVANFGNILVELYAFVGDVLTYYQDNQARESRILTATQRKNLIALAKLIGYRPAGAQAATVDVVFSLAAAPLADVAISAGTPVSTRAVTDPLKFQLLADVVIAATANPPQATGTVEHSESDMEVFISTSLPNQQFILPTTPYLDDSASVVAGNGTYEEVRNFLASTPTDLHFITVVDQNDRATVGFGNGVNGAIPTGTITVNYKVGGGAEGNVEANSLTKLDGSFTDVDGNSVSLSVTNPTPAAGGTDRQTIEQIQILAPESIRVVERTVSREDFEINARQVSGVVRALMLTSNELAAIAENAGVLFVVPVGGGPPSAAIKEAVLEMVTVTKPNTLTFQVAVQDPLYLPINVQATVYLRQGVSAVVVRARIMDALNAFFAISLANGTPNPDIDFGFNVKDADGNPAGEVAWSDVEDTVRNVVGVRKIGPGPTDFMLNGARQDVPLGLQQFPILGTVTIVNGDTGQPL